MQPQPGNSAIDRIIQWLRGSWRELARWRGANESGSGSPAAGTQSRSQSGAAADEPGDAAANGFPDREQAGGTGASQDEFGSGGYTPENPDLETVEEAAEGQVEPERGDHEPADQDSPAGNDPNLSLVDQEMDRPTPPSGNYGVGNLGLGSRASLGETPFAEPVDGDDTDASSEDDAVPDMIADESIDAEAVTNTNADADAGIDLAAAAIPDDTDARQPGVIDGTDLTDLDDAAPGLGGATGADAFSTIDDQNVRGIGDLGADELGSLEELEEDAVAFEDNATERFDANSEPAFERDVPESVAEIGAEADDYSSPALEDAGLRIVDEDDAGLTIREPADDEFVDPGSVIEEPAHDAEDARPLGDFTQEQSGFANENDEPMAAAGDRSETPFGSETGMDTAETWAEGEATENLGAAGELETLDFGSTAGEPESPLAATGLFGESDIDVTDLSYLDESENARYDFAGQASVATAGVDDVPESAGVTDDIGASPTGVRDAGGMVASEEPVATDVPATPFDPYDIPDSSAGVADDIAGSPTGVVDADAATEAADHGDSRGNIPNFATDKDSDPVTPSSTIGTTSPGPGDNAPGDERRTIPDFATDKDSNSPSPTPATDETRSGPGGSVRGDDRGLCPDDHPIKGNSSSKVYHVPGIPSHDGTKAEWCFASEEQAQAAGYRPPGQRNHGAGPSASRWGRSRGAPTR